VSTTLSDKKRGSAERLGDMMHPQLFGTTVWHICLVQDRYTEYDAWRAANQAAARAGYCYVCCVDVCALYASSFNNWEKLVQGV